MSKHTPGPWFEISRSASYIDIVGGLRDAKGLPFAKPGEVATQPVCRVQRHAPGEANANLIKAIPQFLAACEAALKYDAAICRKAETGEYEICADAALAEGVDLDSLYQDWINKAQAALYLAGIDQ